MAGRSPTTRQAPTTSAPPHHTPPARTGLLTRTPARAQARDITIRVQRVEGGLRLSPVQVDQHVVVARNPGDLARAVQSCFAEVEVAAYARWKGVRPDIAALSSGDSFDDPLNRGGKPIATAAPPGDKRRAGAPWASGGARERDPADYTPNADGSWTSPSGRTVRDVDACRRIVRRRVAAGLPITPEDATFDLSALSEQIVAAAVREGVSPHEWLTAAVEKAGTVVVPEPVLPPVVDLAAVRARKAAERNIAGGQLELDLGLAAA